MAAPSTESVIDPAQCRTRYVENMAALYRRDARLAEQIDTLPFSQLPELESTRDGQHTVRLTADDGKLVYAHSRVRPREEAGKLIGALGDVDHPTFVISGLGLGYALQALHERFDRPVLIVAEDDLRLIKAALCLFDYSDWIDDGRVIVLWSVDKTDLSEKLMKCNADVMLGLHFVVPPHAKRYHVAFHKQINAALRDFASTAKTQIITLLKTARTTFQNVAFNLAAYLTQPGLEALANRAAGRPAIVVAAGPSLARNLDQLPGLAHRAVIIAVQTVFKLLRTLGVAPHFVTSLDYHEISAEFFRGLEDVGNCRLVAEPKATWHVLDEYAGRQFVLHHRFIDVLLRDDFTPHAELKPGTTVAHLAFYLAQHLGCDPIIFVGQDLAFSDGMFYLPGSPIEDIWRPELGRFQTIEMKQWERIVRNRPILRRTEDVNARPVYTDDLLFTYAEQFQADFAACTARVIQASEGGLPLAGTQQMTLAQAAEAHCAQPLPEHLFDVEPGAFEPDAAARVLGALEQRIRELERVAEIATEMRELLARLTELVEKPHEFNRRMVRVDELRTMMQEHDAIYRLVVDVSASAELRRYSADRRIGAVQRETAETARRRLHRDLDFVDSFADGCGFLLRVLPEALARLRERLA